jgi:hypothetical protein
LPNVTAKNPSDHNFYIIIIKFCINFQADRLFPPPLPHRPVRAAFPHTVITDSLKIAIEDCLIQNKKYIKNDYTTIITALRASKYSY